MIRTSGQRMERLTPLLPLIRATEKLNAVVVKATLPVEVVLTMSVPSITKLMTVSVSDEVLTKN